VSIEFLGAVEAIVKNRRPLGLKSSQTYLNFSDEKKIGKDDISRKERKGRQGDGPQASHPERMRGI